MENIFFLGFLIIQFVKISYLNITLSLEFYQTLERQCFIRIPNTSNFVKNTPLRVVFPTLFSVFGNVMKQLHMYHQYFLHMGLLQLCANFLLNTTNANSAGLDSNSNQILRRTFFYKQNLARQKRTCTFSKQANLNILKTIFAFLHIKLTNCSSR